jgi:hypothetical protein
MEPALPIVIVEGLAAQVFPSVQSAELYVEPWWVKNGEGKVYTADGHRMIAICQGQLVLLSLDPSSSPQEEELTTVLRTHSRTVGETSIRDDSSLPQLLAKLPQR